MRNVYTEYKLSEYLNFLRGEKMDYKDKIIKKFIAYLMEMIPFDKQNEKKVKMVNDIQNHLISLKVEGRLDFSYEESHHIGSDASGYNILVSHIYLTLRENGELKEEYSASQPDSILSIRTSGVKDSRYIMN